MHRSKMYLYSITSSARPENGVLVLVRLCRDCPIRDDSLKGIVAGVALP